MNLRKKFFWAVGAVFAAVMPLLFPAGVAMAQTAGGTALTITPPFFTLNVSPGDAWASSIRVVNTNAGNLPVVASVMGFSPADEEGHGTFVKLSDLADDSDALANWITVSPSTMVVPPDGAVDVPFSIAVPPDASPGGHYAAILIGTQPADAASSTAGSHIGVSSFISALIFVTVSGDIKESGNLAEFSTDKSLYQDPDVNFTIRFTNTGNVHVRPVGQIQIYNALGKEQGTVAINQSGDLGYVLPSSTRRFDVNWQGPTNLWDIGQYTAVVTLAFGDDGTKSVSQTLTFWVLPIGRLAEDGAGIILVIGCFVFFLRRYIRKTLMREMGHYGEGTSRPPESTHHRRKETGNSNDTVDLRKR